ncbi:MAG: hypothetical protein Q7R70_00555 [Candidatus Diapherotrites archaeon]|nr:hypothetical protein [Candidatus Diapherotrites archaeon]
MLKKTLVLIAVLLFSAIALADVKVVSPVEKYSLENQVIEAGSIQAGETLEIIFSTFSGSQEDWVKASAASLPEGWTALAVLQARNKNTLILHVTAPKTAANGAFQFDSVLEDAKGSQQKAGFLVFVQDDLITSQVDSLKKTANSGEDITFVYTLNNDSIAEHKVEIYSSLPLTWFAPKTLTLKPKSSQQLVIAISPKNYGVKKFSFFTKSLLTEKVLSEISPRIEVKPSLKSKYEAALYGFPFFTPSLLPYYWFNSFIGQLA